MSVIFTLRKATQWVFVSLLSLNLLGCASHGDWAFISYTSLYEAEVVKTDASVHFGPYWTGQVNGRGFQLTKEEFYDKGHLPGAEVAGWWFVRTPNSVHYYYARSLPGKGVVAPLKSWMDQWRYHSYISFGPMVLYEAGLSDDQKQDAAHVRTAPSGLKYFSWGEVNNLYYKVLKHRVDIEETPQNWQMVEGIEISESQYITLNNRCREPWWEVKCFIDINFPDLTAEQMSYVKLREHDNDEARMSGRVDPIPPKTSNMWK